MKTRQQLKTETQQKELIIQQLKQVIDQNNQRIERNKQLIKLLKDESFDYFARKLYKDNKIETKGIGQTPKYQLKFKYIKPGKYLYYSPKVNKESK